MNLLYVPVFALEARRGVDVVVLVQRWSRNQLATQEIIHRFGVKASDATSTHAASCLESAVNQAAASTSQAGGGVDPSAASGSPKADSDGKGTPGTGTDSGDNASGSRSPSHKRRSKRKHKPKLTHQMSSLNMALLDKGTKSLGGGASVNTAQTIEEQLRAMGVDDIDSFRIASTPSPEGNDAEAAAATTSPTSNAARRRRSVSPPHHGQPSSPVAFSAPLPRSTLYAAHADLATSPQPSSPVDASQRQGRNGLKPIRGATQATPEATSPTASAGQRQATASSKRRGRRLSSTEAAMEASGGQFAQYLRDVQVLENKAKAITRRALLDKSVSMVLARCGSVFTRLCAGKRFAMARWPLISRWQKYASWRRYSLASVGPRITSPSAPSSKSSRTTCLASWLTRHLLTACLPCLIPCVSPSVLSVLCALPVLC